MKSIQSLIILGLFAVALAEKTEKTEAANTAERDPKLFSIFTIVNFPNLGCASKTAGRNGTCFTLSECQEKGGKASGNCAAGFGVCCVFEVTSVATRIDQNCTYILNPGYPQTYSDTTALKYTINKCSNEVCQVRLDFETFVILGPADTTETNGGPCTDKVIISGTSGNKSPDICGVNTGEHVYMEMGNEESDTASLEFTFSGTSTIRTFEIKATQIPCASNYRAPDGCLQYHTTNTGRIMSFNYLSTDPVGQHLASQNQNICIRGNAGMCCVRYTLCAGEASTSAWSIDGTDTAMIGSMCLLDYLEIDGGMSECNQGTDGNIISKFCGDQFNTVTALAANVPSVCDCTKPFVLNLVTDAAAVAAKETVAPGNRGLCLDYMQIACD